jgi:hypothetical protein
MRLGSLLQAKVWLSASYFGQFFRECIPPEKAGKGLGENTVPNTLLWPRRANMGRKEGDFDISLSTLFIPRQHCNPRALYLVPRLPFIPRLSKQAQRES